jgi:hypothetical protein
MCVRCAIASEPGPSITRYTPRVDLSWKTLRSIFASSPRTTTQWPVDAARARSLRVSRIRGQSAGISSVVLCRNANPLIVMSDDPENTKLCAPVSVTPPRLWATIVIGARLLPCRLVMVIGDPDGTA